MAMNHSEVFETLLPFYAAGQLTEVERAGVENHLATCADCRAELDFWQAVSGEIAHADRTLAAPPALVDRAVEQIHARPRLAAALMSAWQLLYAQAFLVQHEMWPATAAVMVLGVTVALVSGHAGFFYFLAPLVAAASIAMLSGQDNDPAYELTAATPTSPWKVLLARLSIVSTFNLLLALFATLALLFFSPPGLLGTLTLGWLAPMAFLSALALLLSLWMGSTNAIIVTYALWTLQYAPFQAIGGWMASPAWSAVITAYQKFWQSPLLLLSLSILILVTALGSANRSVFRLNQGPG
jgi:hypothetical protein